MPVEHGKTDIQDLVERYLRGELSIEEEREWEEHYFQCEECFRILEDTAAVARFVKTEAPRSPEWYESGSPRKGSFRSLLEIVSAAPRWQPLLAAAAVLIVIGIPSIMALMRINTLEEEVNRLQSPFVPRQSLILQCGLRGSTPEYTVHTGDGAFLLQFNIPAMSHEKVSHKARISDSDGVTIWSTDTLIGHGTYGTFVISCRASFFPAGEYFLTVDQIRSDDGTPIKTYSFPFRIVREDSAA